jgi:hypothetical protein
MIMLGLDRKKTAAVLLGCAACAFSPAVLGQVADCTELEAAPDTYGKVIYGSGGSATTATLGRIASYLAGLPAEERITVVYYDPGACSGYEQYLNNELFAIPNNTATIKYWIASTEGAPTVAVERTCTLAAPRKLDFSHMGNPHEFCGFSSQLPAGYPDDSLTGATFATSPAPIQTLNLIVDKDSSQTSISAEALYYLFGFGAAPSTIDSQAFAGVAPWTNPVHVVVRPPTAFVHQILSEAIYGVSRQFYDDPGANGQGDGSIGTGRLGFRASTNGQVVSQVALYGSTSAETGIGYVSGSAAETANARNSIKTLAYQHYDQTAGYLPDSNDAIADKANVRNGQYHLWSPGHFYTRAAPGAEVDDRGELLDHDDIRDGNGEPNEALSRFIRWFSSAENEEVLRRVILAGDIPQCASTVTRDGLLGAISSVAPLDPCNGFFLSLATGSATGACDNDDECGGDTPKCRHHFCEAY